MSKFAEINKTGVVVFSRAAESPNQLSLNKGDPVRIVGELGGWYKVIYEHVVENEKRTMKGIYPANHIQLEGEEAKVEKQDRKKMQTARRVGTFEEIYGYSRSPLASEVLQVLKEWGNELIKLKKEKRDQEYDAVKRQMAVLVGLRKKILDVRFNTEAAKSEKEEISDKVIKAIEEGSRQLNLDLVVRLTQGPFKGQRASEKNTPIVDLFRQYQALQKREEEVRRKAKLKKSEILAQEEANNAANADKKTAAAAAAATEQSNPEKEAEEIERIRAMYDLPLGRVQLLLDVKACIFTVGEPTEVYFSLYSSKQKKFVSEDFSVELTALGMPTNEKLISNIKTIFRDIIEKDYLSDMYLVCRIYRKGKMVLENAGGAPSTMTMVKNAKTASTDGFRRPFGVAVLELSPQVISSCLMGGKEFSPGNLALYQPLQENQFSTLHEMIIAQSGNFEEIPKARAIGVAVGITLFQASFDNAVQEYKLTNVCQTKMLDFPEVIVPTNMRNDYYLTVNNGIFADGRNVMVQYKVILKSDVGANPIHCIHRYTNLFAEPQSQGVTPVLYHVHNPQWGETFRIDLPPADLENAVVVFIASHCSNKRSRVEPFGFGFFPLESGGVLKPDDKPHRVEIYKYVKDCEKVLVKNVNDTSKYVSVKSQIYLKSKLVSTRTTQDVHLNNLLKWKTRVKNIAMEQILDQFSYIGVTEVIKFIREIFDALFTILVHHDTEQIANLVFGAILRTVDSFSKKQFVKQRIAVDEYIENCFNFPEAYKWLLHCTLKNLEYNEGDKKQLKVLSQTMTSFHYLFRFMIVSRSQFESKSIDGGAADKAIFLAGARKCFDFVNKVMTVQGNTSIIAAQDQSLKLMASLFQFPKFAQVFDPKEYAQIGKTFVEIIPNTGRKNTIDGKLTVLNAMAKGEIIVNPISRNIILPTVVSMLKHHFLQSLSERRHCTKILAEALSTFHKKLLDGSETEKSVKTSLMSVMTVLPEAISALKVYKRDKQELLNKLAKIRQDTGGEGKGAESEDQRELELLNQEMSKFEESRGEIIATLISFFYLMDLDLLTGLLAKSQVVTGEDSIAKEIKPAQLIIEVLDCLNYMISDSPIPEFWIAFNTFNFGVVHDTLNLVAQYLKNNCRGSKFSFDLWTHFFTAAIEFVHSPRLQLENFTSSKQNKILAIRPDMRVTMIKSLVDAWNSLGDQQINFVPHLVAPILQLSTIAKKEIFADALNIYCALIEREFKKTKSVKQCEGVTVVVLDEYIVKELIDDQFKAVFVNVLEERFKKDPSITTEGMRFLNQTKLLMDHIQAVQRYNDKEEDEKTNALLKVMDYVKEREELYYKYLHTLAKTHANNNNFVEAGMTLMIHCNKLSFKSDQMLARISDEYPQEPENVRKEKLYQRCIDYFDKGKDWERAIKLIRELAPIYEHETYEYKKLGDLFKKQSEFFEKVANQKRFFSSYFYVAYYGKGFQELGLMNKEYIYKGNEAERLMDFVERIMKRFPNAEMLKPLEKPSKDQVEGDGQYIQIMTVYPCSPKDIETKLAAKPRNPKISSNISSYADSNDVILFNYTKTYRKNPKDKEMLEQRDLFTNIYFQFIAEPGNTNKQSSVPDSYPTIVRRKDIVKKLEVVLSPLENAVKNIEDKNAECMELIISHDLDAKPDTNKLSMLLNGVIDAAVMGGVSKYLAAFFAEDFVKSNPQEIPNVQRFQRALGAQLDVLGKGLECYRKFGKAATRKHVEHLENLHKNMKEQLKAPIERKFD